MRGTEKFAIPRRNTVVFRAALAALAIKNDRSCEFSSIDSIAGGRANEPVRTFINRTRLTVQHVPEEIYKASYPSWFFELDEILSPFLKHYNLEAKFDPFPGYIIDLQDDTGYYKGFHLKKK